METVKKKVDQLIGLVCRLQDSCAVKTESVPVCPVNFEASPGAKVSKDTAVGLRSLMFGSGRGTSLPQEWWQG